MMAPPSDAWFNPVNHLANPAEIDLLRLQCARGNIHARELLCDLASAGNPDAQALIAAGFFNVAHKENTEADLFACEVWLRKAAGSGNAAHLLALGSFLIHVAGVETSQGAYDVDTCLTHALLLSEQAADLGNEIAANAVVQLTEAAPPAVMETIRDMRAAETATRH